MRYETALRRFGERCEEFAAELTAEGATPDGLEEGEERGEFYWSEEDAAWQHGGFDGWEFIGSVCWEQEDSRWVADWQEHA